MPSLLYSNIFHILNLPISPYHCMKEPYFVISVKDMGEKNHIVCVCSMLDSFWPSNCLNVILSCIIYHNKFFEIFCLSFLCLFHTVFQ